jgi:prevent-host-death family protein
MRAASVTEIAADFALYLKASEQEPIVVTRRGRPVAVLLRAGTQEDLERLLMGHSPKLQAILEAARKRFRAGAGIPHESFWKEVEAENAGRMKKQSSSRKNGRTNPKN